MKKTRPQRARFLFVISRMLFVETFVEKIIKKRFKNLKILLKKCATRTLVKTLCRSGFVKKQAFARVFPANACWSWWRDLNPRPIDYESIALPLRHTSTAPTFAGAIKIISSNSQKVNMYF